MPLRNIIGRPLNGSVGINNLPQIPRVPGGMSRKQQQERMHLMMEVQCGVLECGILIIELDVSFLFEVCVKCGIGVCV